MSGILYLLTLVILLAMDWNRSVISPTLLAWGNVVGLVLGGIASILVGLDFVWCTKRVLDWLAKHVRWWIPPAWSLRLFGCFLSLEGVLATVVVMSCVHIPSQRS